MIEHGLFHLGQSARGAELTEYHVQAGIAACHSTAPNDAATDWPRILGLYDQLLKLKPSPITQLNRAVAVARVQGPAAGLAALDEITPRTALDGYLLSHAVRGSLVAELGRPSEAVAHFRQAEALAVLSSEKEFLAQRIAECSGS